MDVITFSIRKASIEDIPYLIELGLIAYGQYAETLGAENWTLMQAHLGSDKMYKDLLEKSTCFVVSNNEDIAGMAFLVKSGNPIDVYKKEWSAIRLLAVNPLYKGQGIAKTLTKLCIDHAINTGETTVALHTSPMMPAAVHIYDKFGFKIVTDLGKRYNQQYYLYKLDLSAKTSAP